MAAGASTIEPQSTDSGFADGTAAVDALLAELDALAGRAATVLDRLDAATERGEGRQLTSVAARRAATLTTRLAQVAERSATWATLQVARSRAHVDDALSTPGRWVERHLGVAKRDAHRLGRAAVVIDRLPLVARAYARGELRLAHLDAIARIVPARLRGAELLAAWELVAEVQAELLLLAERTDLAGFELGCGRVRDRLDVDGPPDRSAEPSQVWLAKTFDGRWSLVGDLNADDGALLAAYLEKRTRAELKAGDAAPKVEGDDRRPLAEVRARALLSLARDGAGARAPGRVALHLHADLDDLASRGVIVRRPAHTEAGNDISAETLWALLADAEVTPYYWDRGKPLWYGTTHRLAPDALRRVLAHRDGTCRFPGCRAPAIWTDAHHDCPASADGTTDPCNCYLLCRFHHTLHHQQGWNLRYDPEQDVVRARRPDGRPFDADQRWLGHRHRRDPDRAAALARIAALSTS